MTPTEMAASLRVLSKLCSILFFTLLAQKILSVITYSWEELLDIRATSISALQPGIQLSRSGSSAPPREFEADPKQLHWRRGRWSGLLVRLQSRAHHLPLPSILLTNVQSLDSKFDEIRTPFALQRDIRDCNILCFTETWLSKDILSESVQPPGCFMHRVDRNKHLSGKKKGGVVCFMINNSWCNRNNIQELKSFCSPDLEFLTIKCQPYYHPREFSSIIVTAVYIPP